MTDGDDLIAALAPVAEAFCRLGVGFYVGGSIASTFHGAVRSTMDVDLVCNMGMTNVVPFVQSFGDDYYVNVEAVRDAVQRKSCFNLIHMPSSYKVDVFVSRERPFDVMAMERATAQPLGGDEGLMIPIATAEDSIVAKLEWFRLTSETSERQWDDVSRLVALLGDSLDTAYMERMAASVGVADLLRRLLTLP